jgi:SAM-dependent methyltransferase
MTDFVPHRAVWTQEKSTRFRDELFSVTGGDEKFYRPAMAKSLIRFAETHGGNTGGETLFAASPPGTLPIEAYSMVVAVDTIEHLQDDQLRPLLAELHRALRPGGSIVVAAPNEEKLEMGETVCPDCGCLFHRSQHVRSWTADGLAAYMSEYGFDMLAATPWYLEERWWKSRLVSAVARALRKRLPHFIYVGRKRVAG